MLLIGFLAKHWTVITLLLRLLGQHMHTLWYIPLFTEVSTWLWRKTTKGHICGLRWCSFSLCEICFFTWEAKCIFCPSKHSVQWIENFTFLCLKTELLIVFFFFFPTERQKASVFLETVWDAFLYQHIKKPTHFTGDQTPNVLDFIFTNEDGMIEDLVHQAPLGKSHHQVLQFHYVCYSNTNSLLHRKMC